MTTRSTSAEIDERWEREEQARVSRADNAYASPPENVGAQLVCQHGFAPPIVVDDCAKGRTGAYWRALAPPGVQLTVTLWPNGWGRPGERHDIPLDGSEVQAPPVAGTMPTRLRIHLPHGPVRTATLMPTDDGITYGLELKPGDSQGNEAWEAVVPTKPKEPERGRVGQGALARARARARARDE